MSLVNRGTQCEVLPEEFFYCLEVLRDPGQPSHTMWNTPVRPFGDDEHCILQ